MNSTDAYHISLRLYSGYEESLKEQPSLTPYEMIEMEQDEEIAGAWDRLSETEKTALYNFVIRYESLYDSFPENHQTAEDMEKRQELIMEIEDNLFKELEFVIE